MALYIVSKANPYFRNGEILELLEDGFQRCVLVKNPLTGREEPRNHEGLIMPEEDIMPFVIKMLNKGFDDPKLRRKSGRGSTGKPTDKIPEYLH